jgi:prepilin-type N-terminal cleavage/methylation domain-containing protein
MRRNQKGFTLMELMVVIVIVAILAAVAVPLYINYVKDASRTEAKGAIGAIITAEQTYFQQNQTYMSFGPGDPAGWKNQSDPTKRLNCDITEAQNNWDFQATGSATDLTIQADGKTSVNSVNGLQVIYTLHPGAGQTSNWQEK